MKTIERIGEKKVLLDTEKDELLYDARKNFNGQGSATRWTDVYVHRCADGTVVFYEAHYTLWQGEDRYIRTLPLDEARRFAEAHYEELECDDEALRAWGLVDIDKVE